MQDEDKSKEQLICELHDSRKRVSELEMSRPEPKQYEKPLPKGSNHSLLRADSSAPSPSALILGLTSCLKTWL